MDPVVILATDAVAAGPGGEARLLARVRNQGRRVESYVVEVLGEPSRFCQVEPRNVSVFPGKEAEITITFRPPVGASTPTGSLPFGVRAVSEVGSSSSAVAEGRLELAGAAGLQAWADATTAAGRWKAVFRLQFSNQGNAPARLFVAAHDPAAAVRLTVRDEVLAVPPGAQVDTEVRVKARQPFLRGRVVNRSITASCQDFPFGAERPTSTLVAPKDDPNHRTFQLTFQQKPIVSKLVLALGALLVVALVGLAVLRLRSGKDVVLGLARPGTPLGLQTLAQGSTSVFLSWDRVPNAAGYEVYATTPEGQLSGAALFELPASSTTQTAEDLTPNTQYCFAVVALGPEGVDPSTPSQHGCVTTDAPPTIEAPVNFAATETSPGVYALSWEHTPVEGVTYTVFQDGGPVKPGVVETTTTLDLEVRDIAYPAVLTVRADLNGEQSNSSNPVPVMVAAKPVAATTTVPGGVGGPGGPGGNPGTTPGATTTSAPSSATTTTASGTTTTVPTPAQGQLRDVEERWAAWFVTPVQPSPAGAGKEAQRQDIAADFGITPEQVLTLNNRDTEVRDGAARDPLIQRTAPSVEFFYVPALDQQVATNLCAPDPRRCVPRVVEGAANAAEGTPIIVIDELPPTTPLAEVDATLERLRTDLGYRDIYVLDGTRRPGLGSTDLVIFASNFTDETARQAFCASSGLPACEPVQFPPN